MNILSAFTLTDGIILVAVLAILALVIFFGFVKKGKKSGCKGCPYAKNCSSPSCDCKEKNGRNTQPPPSETDGEKKE